MRIAAVLFVWLLMLPPYTEAVDRSWDDGGLGKNWSDPDNWNPNGDPGSDDLTIGDLVAAFGDATIVNADFSVFSVTVQGGASFDTDGNELLVNGHTSLNGGGAILRANVVSPTDPDSLDTNTLTVSGITTELLMHVGSILEVDNGLFFLDGATLMGNGAIELNDNPAGPTTLLDNSGTISVGEPAIVINPPPRTLTITSTSANARVDLDGSTGTGNVFLQSGATLDIDVAIGDDAATDAFGGTITLGPGSTLDISNPWQVNTGNIVANTSLVFATEEATIAGGMLTLESGATVDINEGDEAIRFAATLTANNGSTIANAGTVIFDATALFSAAADFQMIGNFASIVVNTDVTIDQDDFNIDGVGLPTNVITINEGGLLSLNITSFDGGTNKADGVITINSGELEAVVGTGLVVDGTVTLNNTDGNPAIISAPVSQTLFVGDDVGTSDANLIVGGTGESQINTRGVQFRNDADVDIAAGAVLNLNGIAVYDGASATFDGGGTLKPGLMRVIQDATFNIAVVDLEDGAPPGGMDQELDAILTINADAIDDDGDGFDGDMTIDNTGTDNVVEPRTGLLNVNTTSGSWQFDSGTITVDGAFSNLPIVFSGSDIDVGTEGGTIVVNRGASTTARMNIFGTIQLPAAIDRLVLAGGFSGDPNRLEGGLIEGTGTLELSGSLHGFGEVQTDIEGTSLQSLLADNGLLTISGSLSQLAEVGTADDDGILDVTNPWSTNVASSVELNGGELTGAAINNDNPAGIRGDGLITASVDNATRIVALNGQTLILDNPATDYDGTINSGELLAVAGSLELRDNAAFAFQGDLTIGSGRELFVNGFAMNFNASSTLSLSNATYRSTHGSDIHTSVFVNLSTGPSTVDTDGTVTFHSDSAATLNNDLQVDNANTVIEAGATFSGAGTLVNLRGATLTLLDTANVGVVVENRGTLEIGASPGRADVVDYLQTTNGTYAVELMGAGLGQFDRLVVSGQAQLGGTLDVTLLGGFNPALGDQFAFLSTVGGIIDDFEVFILPTLDPGLAWSSTISNNYVLEVIAGDPLAADVDLDGDVDGRDFLLIQRNDPSLIPQWETEFGTGVGPLVADSPWRASSQAVPEPSAALLAMLVVGLQLASMRAKTRFVSR